MTFPNLGNLGIGRGDDDDLFAHTRMSFGDHIEELRMRMIRAILGFLIALVVGLFVGKWVLDQIQKPVREQLLEFYNHRISEMQKKVSDDLSAKMQDDAAFQKYMNEQTKMLTVQVKEPGEGGEWKTMDMRILPREVAAAVAPSANELAPPASLTTLTITEAFMTYFMVSIYCGIVLASPWIFWQLWQFIAAGLYPHEKKYVYVYLPLSLGLFLAGCALAQWVVLPLGIRYLLSFNDWLGVEPELRLSEWLGFAIMVPLIFGVAFQTPLVMLFLERMGIVEITLYTKNRKLAYFVLAIVGAILAAAPDALNMMMLTVPLWSLFEFGILLCRFAPRPKSELEEPDPEEMVEV
jgi:sec-independent protein translocase protein TatC